MEFKSKILSKRIQDLIYGQGKTLATAESCTGGRIAEAIIATPGASDFFKGGIISYTNEVKENLLGVSHEVIEEQTAVCEEVAKQMVLGVIKALNVDFAISSTGIAGPAGGTKEIGSAKLRLFRDEDCDWILRGVAPQNDEMEHSLVLNLATLGF